MGALAKDLDLEEILDLAAVMAPSECHLVTEIGELVTCEKINVSKHNSEVIGTMLPPGNGEQAEVSRHLPIIGAPQKKTPTRLLRCLSFENSFIISS